MPTSIFSVSLRAASRSVSATNVKCPSKSSMETERLVKLAFMARGTCVARDLVTAASSFNRDRQTAVSYGRNVILVSRSVTRQRASSCYAKNFQRGKQRASLGYRASEPGVVERKGNDEEGQARGVDWNVDFRDVTSFDIERLIFGNNSPRASTKVKRAFVIRLMDGQARFRLGLGQVHEPVFRGRRQLR